MDDFLCCLNLPSNAAGLGIFTTLEECVSERSKSNRSNQKEITNVTANYSGIVKMLWEAGNHFDVWNRFIHYRTLVSKCICLQFYGNI